ncbi:hypothetical protein EDB83DRAFT_696547 [Lactarius deliciosus]|nr:hypothetical protein EDB83DRAFT_696547 [Lactarius deliciosus]
MQQKHRISETLKMEEAFRRVQIFLLIVHAFLVSITDSQWDVQIVSDVDADSPVMPLGLTFSFPVKQTFFDKYENVPRRNHATLVLVDAALQPIFCSKATKHTLRAQHGGSRSRRERNSFLPRSSACRGVRSCRSTSATHRLWSPCVTLRSSCAAPYG